MTREVDELNHVLEAVSAGELTSVPPGRLGLLGHSRGGADAILSSHETGLVDALVTWGAIDHLERWATEIVREWEENGVLYVVDQRTGQRLPLAVDVLKDYRVNRERLDLHAAASALTPPWLIVHGEEDLTVPVGEGRRLAGSSREARLLILEGAGHTFEAEHPFKGSTPSLDRALAASIRHFRRHLGGD